VTPWTLVAAAACAIVVMRARSIGAVGGAPKKKTKAKALPTPAQRWPEGLKLTPIPLGTAQKAEPLPLMWDLPDGFGWVQSPLQFYIPIGSGVEIALEIEFAPPSTSGVAITPAGLRAAFANEARWKLLNVYTLAYPPPYWPAALVRADQKTGAVRFYVLAMPEGQGFWKKALNRPKEVHRVWYRAAQLA
jgi:hypothetical protein